MPVTDVVVDEIVATVRTVDSAALLDPRLVRRLVQAVLAGMNGAKQLIQSVMEEMRKSRERETGNSE